MKSLYGLRSFVAVSVAPKERDRAPPPLVLPEAHIRWGQQADFSVTEYEALTQRYGVNTSGQKDKDQKRPRIKCQGGLSYTTFTIVNPLNPECYAVVQCAARGDFEYTSFTQWAGKPGRTNKYTMPGGSFTLHMKPSRPDVNNPQEGSGQTPEAPPDIEDIE